MMMIESGVMANAPIAPSNEKEASIISRYKNIAKAALPTNIESKKGQKTRKAIVQYPLIIILPQC